MEKRYPDGMFDFKALVTGGYYFVDKTLLIAEICGADNMTFLYTRPRRFGKSINLSMIDYYFNIRYKDTENIFSGLKIGSCEKCKPHMNAYPVIKMNFGDFDSSSLENFRGSMVSLISSVARQAVRDLSGLLVDETYRGIIRSAADCTIGRIDSRRFIRTLCEVYREVFGKKPIILVDEYDHCIQNIRSEELFESIVGELRPFMEQTFKFNDDLGFGFVTGIMPLAKTSMLSSFNNASICSILDDSGDESFGFTEDEVLGLLKETGNSPDKMDEIKAWYDGYRFGNAEVYNPYSVMLYLKNHCRPEAYWNNMTGGGLSSDLVSDLGAESLGILRRLYEDPGSFIESPVDVRIICADVITPSAKPSAVYSYLAMVGYLKAVRTDAEEDGKPICRLSMVNKEVTYSFSSLVERATVVEKVADLSVYSLYEMNPNKTKKNIEALLSGLAMDSTWRQDVDPTARHNRYRDVVFALLSTPDILAKEEVRKGYGMTDIFFPAKGGRRPIVLEVKTTIDPEKDLKRLSEEALDQIEDRAYADEPGMEKAIMVGLGIRMKTVEVSFRER